jgi:hypothetical protein
VLPRTRPTHTPARARGSADKKSSSSMWHRRELPAHRLVLATTGRKKFLSCASSSTRPSNAASNRRNWAASLPSALCTFLLNTTPSSISPPKKNQRSVSAGTPPTSGAQIVAPMSTVSPFMVAPAAASTCVNASSCCSPSAASPTRGFFLGGFAACRDASPNRLVALPPSMYTQTKGCTECSKDGCLRVARNKPFLSSQMKTFLEIII